MLLWMDYFIYLCRDSNPPRYPQQQQQQQPSRPKINGSEMSLNRQKSIKDLNREKNVFFQTSSLSGFDSLFSNPFSHSLSLSFPLSDYLTLSHSLSLVPASIWNFHWSWLKLKVTQIPDGKRQQSNKQFLPFWLLSDLCTTFLSSCNSLGFSSFWDQT